ncbi:MAG TPA: nucleoid occlusion factor SlmA [Rhodocyclaceae bacterium]|nr:nucleoid occlusion factor SlmA [Rhodocyclaceae bacterium]
MAAKPGERRLQIMQTLAEMLEQPKGDKITTAAIAARLGVSEAALYRHFASKAQMYEGLIDFIETSLFSVINQATSDTGSGLQQAQRILALLLGFAQKNRGLTRVLIGDALVHENVRLQHRINQILDRIEAALKQALRIGVLRAELAEGSDVAGAANLLLCFAIGRWQQFVKSEFRRDPTADWPTPWLQLASACGVVPQPIGSAA